MTLKVRFSSANYEPVHWGEILKKCYDQFGASPTVLGNQGYFLLPKTYLDFEILHFVTPDYTGSVYLADLKWIENGFLADCGIYVAKIPEINRGASCHLIYIAHCIALSQEALACVNKILRYTCEHIESRESDGMPLIQNDVIKFTIAAIITQIESAKKLLTTAQDIYALSSVVQFLMKSVHQLAELGGGRSMLRGNAIEFLFHLTVFQSLLLL